MSHFRRLFLAWAGLAAGVQLAEAQTGLPVISISPARVAEGQTGERILHVPLFLSAPSASPVTVAWSASGGTAESGSDFTPAGGTVTFAAGEVRQSIPLSILGDVLDESDETITLLLTTPAGASLGNDTAEVRIINDEKLTVVAFSVESPLSEKNHPVEGLPSVGVYNPQPGRKVDSRLANPPGTATAGADFTALPATTELTAARFFPDFSVIDDALSEPDETISLQLTNPGPSVFIQPRNAAQTLPAAPVPGSLAVDGDVMAAGGADGLRLYVRQAGLWTLDAFLENTTGGVFSVAVDRGVVAADFSDSGVKILSRTGPGAWAEQALIPRGDAPLDSRRVIALQDDILVLGDPAASGQTSVSGEVRVHERHLGGPSAWGLSSTLQPVGPTPDFGSVVALHGTTVAVGAPSAFSVSVFERNPLTHRFDPVVEHIRILQNFGRSIALNHNTLVMTGPGVLLTSRRPDAASGPWTAPVQQVTLPQNQFVTQVFFQNNVLWSWHATPGLRSYTTGTGTAWISQGPLALPATPVPANRRLAMSDTEVVVTGTEAEGSVPLLIHRDAMHNATLVDDEDLVITVANLTVSGGSAAVAVSLSKRMPVPVTVECVPMDGTATASEDYDPANTLLTIPSGTTTAYIGVNTTAPDAGEPVEFFRIKLQNPSMGTVGPDGIITIQPPFPILNMTNFSYDLPEGNSGSTTVFIHVNLSAPAAAGASFNWIAENGSATVGTDFPAASGTVNLTAGATTATFSLSFLGDITPESDEYISVRLTDVVGVSLGGSQTSYVNMMNDDIGTVVADSYSTPQNTPLTGMNVRANDLDVDLIQVRVTPQNGGLAPMISGAFVYTPNTNFIGTDSFTYSNYFTLSSGGIVTTTVTINVTDTNTPPLLKPDNYTVREDTLLVIPTTSGLLNNDSLFNSSGVAFDPILEKEIINVTNGTVSNFANSNGTFNFMPARNFSGIATFSYRVRDKDGWSLPALVSITVTDDFAMSPLQRLQPLGSQLYRSAAANINFPLNGELDWPVKLKAGQTVSMRAGTTGSLSIMSMYDSNGTPVTGGLSGLNSLEHIPIPADGTYLITAGFRSGGGSGPFLLVVNGGAGPSTTTAASPYNLDAGQTPGSLRAAVAAIMPNSVAPHHHTFEGTAGETVRIYLHSTLPQSFTLQNPAGTVFANSLVSPHDPNASSLTFTLTETGPHRIVVAGVRLAEYSLELTREGKNLEYSAAALPLLENRGFGHLAGRGLPAGTASGPVTTFAAFADYGANTAAELDVSNMVKSWNPDFVVVGGDHNYASDYTVGSPTWTTHVGNYYGSFMLRRADNRYPEQTSPIQRFFPAPGNHDSGPDFNNGGELSGYFDYLYSNPGGLPRLPPGVHQPMLNYYKMRWGNSEFYFLDSDNASVNPGARTIQRLWLKEQLATSTAKWKFAVWHHPPYSSSSSHGSQAFMQWGQDFQGLTAIFTGHDHTYERLDAGYGVTQFVTGLGGAGPYQFQSSPLPNTLARYNAKHGALLVAATDDGVRFEFRAIGRSGGELIDSYQIGTFDAGVVPSGTDTWSLRVQPGQSFRITTRTPAAPGSLTNDLIPVLSVYDADGVLVATDRNSAPDGRNASILCTVPAAPGAPPEGLLWTVKIANNSSGAGEYELEVTTPDTAAYKTWADLQISNPANPSDRDTQADPDLDGVPNLLEYLLATDPTVPNLDSPLTITPAAPPGGAAPGSAQLLLRLPANWTVPITVQLQSSETLTSGSWITEAVKNPNSPWIAPPGSTPQPAPGGGYTLPLPPNTPRRFHRLRLGFN